MFENTFVANVQPAPSRPPGHGPAAPAVAGSIPTAKITPRAAPNARRVKAARRAPTGIPPTAIPPQTRARDRALAACIPRLPTRRAQLGLILERAGKQPDRKEELEVTVATWDGRTRTSYRRSAATREGTRFRGPGRGARR